jgi:hypothetical protein
MKLWKLSELPRLIERRLRHWLERLFGQRRPPPLKQNSQPRE